MSGPRPSFYNILLSWPPWFFHFSFPLNPFLPTWTSFSSISAKYKKEQWINIWISFTQQSGWAITGPIRYPNDAKKKPFAMKHIIKWRWGYSKCWYAYYEEIWIDRDLMHIYSFLHELYITVITCCIHDKLTWVEIKYMEPSNKFETGFFFNFSQSKIICFWA